MSINWKKYLVYASILGVFALCGNELVGKHTDPLQGSSDFLIHKEEMRFNVEKKTDESPPRNHNVCPDIKFYTEDGTWNSGGTWTINAAQYPGNGPVEKEFGYTTRYQSKHETHTEDFVCQQKFVYDGKGGAVLTEEVALSCPSSVKGVDLEFVLCNRGLVAEHYDNVKTSEGGGYKRASVTREIVKTPDGKIIINGIEVAKVVGGYYTGSLAENYLKMFRNVEKTCDVYIQAKETLQAALKGNEPLPQGAFLNEMAKVVAPGQERLRYPTTLQQPHLTGVLTGQKPLDPPTMKKEEAPLPKSPGPKWWVRFSGPSVVKKG